MPIANVKWSQLSNSIKPSLTFEDIYYQAHCTSIGWAHVSYFPTKNDTGTLFIYDKLYYGASGIPYFCIFCISP